MNPTPIHAVILAGGSGTRFWPKSRLESPKQLCTIGDGQSTMIEKTIERLNGFIPAENRMIVTHIKQQALTEHIVGNSCPLILAEPEAKNTAAALAMAAIEIEQNKRLGSEPIMVSFHADHVIGNLKAFLNTIEKAIKVAREDQLCLIGINPTGPETGFGYIEKGEKSTQVKDAWRVQGFKEKPNFETAHSYFKSGGYLWNSGLFTWKTKTICQELQSYLPKTYQKLLSICNKYRSFTKAPLAELAEVYASLESIAIDHAILEKSNRVSVVGGDFGWSDVGSWDALGKTFPTDSNGNISYGDNLLIDCKGVTADSDGPYVAVIGMENTVVVASKGAILICPQGRAQEVKTIVEHLKKSDRAELL